MKTKFLILTSGILLLILPACLFSDTGKARIVIPQGHVHAADLDLLEVWSPYGYHCIDWRAGVVPDSRSYLISRGSVKGELLTGSYQIMDHFVSGNELDVDSINRSLEEVPAEQVKMIHKHGIFNSDSLRVWVGHFIVFTKNPDWYLNGDSVVLARAEQLMVN